MSAEVCQPATVGHCDEISAGQESGYSNLRSLCQHQNHYARCKTKQENWKVRKIAITAVHKQTDEETIKNHQWVSRQGHEQFPEETYRGLFSIFSLFRASQHSANSVHVTLAIKAELSN